MTVIDERAALLDTLTLAHGAHSSFEEGVCAMEAVAWLAGEEHSDHPSCVSPVIGVGLAALTTAKRASIAQPKLAAAWAAARDAARDALAPLVKTLQDSACQLVERMCEVGR